MGEKNVRRDMEGARHGCGVAAAKGAEEEEDDDHDNTASPSPPPSPPPLPSVGVLLVALPASGDGPRARKAYASPSLYPRGFRCGLLAAASGAAAVAAAASDEPTPASLSSVRWRLSAEISAAGRVGGSADSASLSLRARRTKGEGGERALPGREVVAAEEGGGGSSCVCCPSQEAFVGCSCSPAPSSARRGKGAYIWELPTVTTHSSGGRGNEPAPEGSFGDAGGIARSIIAPSSCASDAAAPPPLRERTKPPPRAKGEKEGDGDRAGEGMKGEGDDLAGLPRTAPREKNGGAPDAPPISKASPAAAAAER
jgi:hypothetical protein